MKLMRRFFRAFLHLAVVMLLVLFIVAGVAMAQTTTPPPTSTSLLSHFSISGSALGFMNSTGSQPASIVGVNFQVTNTFLLGYQQIQVSGISTNFDMGIAGYGRPLSSLLGKNLANKLLFDASQVNVEFVGGIGKQLTSAPAAASHIAETLGVYLSYPISSNVSFQMIGAQWVHGASNGFVTSPSTAALSSGLSINF